MVTLNCIGRRVLPMSLVECPDLRNVSAYSGKSETESLDQINSAALKRNQMSSILSLLKEGQSLCKWQ